MTTRIYVVESDDSFNLVEAKSKAAALRHVALTRYSVSVAKQKTLIGTIKDGVPIQVAANDEEPEPAQAA